MDELEEQDHVREEELAQAHRERDRQRAAAEHKAQVVEEQAAELRQKDQALEDKETELQREKAAITTLTVTLMEKDVVLEAREVAIRNAEIALKEREASLSMLWEQTDAARTQLEEAQECIKGKYPRFTLS